MLAIEGDALLTPHEREAFAEFQQKVLQLVDQRLFEVRFQQPFRLRQAGELQDVRVFDEVAGLLDFVPFLSQRQHAGFVATQSQPLEQQRVDLPIQLTRGPTGVDRFGRVKATSVGVFDAKQQPVMSPRQFVTQCVTIWIRQVEIPHLLQVRAIKPFAKFVRQSPRKL